MSTPVLIAIVSVGVVLGLFVGVIVWAFIKWRRFDKLLRDSPPRPILKCLSCKSDQIDVKLSGLWEGEDASGNHIHGINEYGVCKQCGSHCARYEDDKPYIPTDAEWQSMIGPSEERQRQVMGWPFEEGEKSH
jgi:hypothetical protein